MPFSAPTLPRRLARSAFITATSKLASGQLLAAAVPLLAAPIIGRLYTPSDYAPLAAFAAISAVVGTVSTLQLSNAIIAERRAANANAIAGFCLVLAFGAAVPVLADRHGARRLALAAMCALGALAFLWHLGIASRTALL
ncbi:MAG: hypothetical protein AAFY85_06230, partial [Pseudomonadota bacterium]